MLHATPFAHVVAAVIEDENDDVVVLDEGAYLRVLAPGICRLSRAALEAATGPAIRFPGDLEARDVVIHGCSEADRRRRGVDIGDRTDGARSPGRDR